MYLESKANNALWHNCHKVPQENQSLVFPAFWQVSCSFSFTAHLSDKCFPTGQFKNRLGFQFQFSFGLEFPGADFSFAREITSNPSIRLGSFIPSALSHVGSAHQNFTNHSLSKIACYLPISQNSSFPVFGVRDSYLVLSGKLIGSRPMVTLLLSQHVERPPWRRAMRLGVCLFSTKMRLGLPWWLSDTESACSAADLGSIPRSGRSPSQEDPPEKGVATRCSSCLENPMDRGTWQATVHGISKSWTWLKRLSMHACKMRLTSNSRSIIFNVFSVPRTFTGYQMPGKCCQKLLGYCSGGSPSGSLPSGSSLFSWEFTHTHTHTHTHIHTCTQKH